MKKRPITRLLKAILFALPLAVAPFAHAADSTSTPAANKPLTTVKVGHLLVPGQAKIFIAKDLGYFADQGLDVQLVEFTNSADGLAAVRAAKVDFGVFGATANLFHIAKGADIRIVGGIHNEDAALIIKPETSDKIKTVADLKGRKIAVVRLSTGDVALRGKLQELGIDPTKDVKIFELKSPPAVIAAVQAGEVDAGMVWEPHIVRAKEIGLQVVATSHDLMAGHPCCRLATQTDYAKQHPDVVEKFLVALIEAEKFGHENRPEAVKITTKYLKLDEYVVDRSYLNDQPTDPDLVNTTRFWNVLHNVGFAEEQKNISEYVDSHFYKSALDKLAAANPADAYYKKLEVAFADHATSDPTAGK
jgi:NitT/TauT family transport system substrate-binding protein